MSALLLLLSLILHACIHIGDATNEGNYKRVPESSEGADFLISVSSWDRVGGLWKVLAMMQMWLVFSGDAGP